MSGESNAGIDGRYSNGESLRVGCGHSMHFDEDFNDIVLFHKQEFKATWRNGSAFGFDRLTSCYQKVAGSSPAVVIFYY
jgi:hypothetical protein